MPHTTYFWQAGSLPGIGAFPAGIAVTVDDDGRTILRTAPLAAPVRDAPESLHIRDSLVIREQPTTMAMQRDATSLDFPQADDAPAFLESKA